MVRFSRWSLWRDSAALRAVNRVSYAPAVQTWIFSAISIAAPAPGAQTPWPLLRVSHDCLWVLCDAFLWNERDPHAPAGIVSEELSELGQGQLFAMPETSRISRPALTRSTEFAPKIN